MLLGIYLLLLVVFSFLLIRATDILVTTIKSIARKSKLGKYAVTSFLLALATSLPELFVGLTAAIENEMPLVLGNVIGSNIANISLVIGGAALFGGVIKVKGEYLKRDIIYTFLIACLPLLLLIDSSLSRGDGLVLIATYAFYNVFILKGQKKADEEDNFVRRLIRRLKHNHIEKDLERLALGVVLLIFSADMIVRIAKQIAIGFKVPLLLVGLFLVALGTSLPELAFEIKAVAKGQASMAFGDLLGSVVANASLVLGLSTLIRPIEVSYMFEYLTATVFFLIIYGLFYLFISTKKALERWEGAFLILVYFVFLFVELAQR